MIQGYNTSVVLYTEYKVLNVLQEVRILTMIDHPCIQIIVFWSCSSRHGAVITTQATGQQQLLASVKSVTKCVKIFPSNKHEELEKILAALTVYCARRNSRRLETCTKFYLLLCLYEVSPRH